MTPAYSPTETTSEFALHIEALTQLFTSCSFQGSFNLSGLFFVITVLLFSSLWWTTAVGFLAVPVFLFTAAVLAAFCSQTTTNFSGTK